MAIWKIILLSMLPVSELRGAIPLAIASGISPINAFLIAVIANALIVPILFFFLDTLHKHFYMIKYYRIPFDRYIERTRKKFENHAGTKLEYFFLFLFVAVPLPMTGAYTGTLIAWLFNMQRRKSSAMIILGVLAAGIITTLVTVGIKSIISIF